MYAAAGEFVREHLAAGDGKSCLVVGSPLFEAIELIDRGWDVTYLDVRIPPHKFKKFVHCDAAAMPFEDESFDALSSTCVLSHVGMGRYGDPLVDHGDEKALAHMARVLKPNALATIMFGNVAAMPEMVRLGTCHRIFTMDECRSMLAAVPLHVEEARFWSLSKKAWFKDEKEITSDFMIWPDYVSFLVRKC
jgi:SAM-dependent methyltransferase